MNKEQDVVLTIKEPTDDSVEALILLCRALLSTPGNSVAKISEKTPLTKNQFDLFMKQGIAPAKIFERHRQIATSLYETFITENFLTGPKRKLMDFVYDALPAELSDHAQRRPLKVVVENSEVLTQKSQYAEDITVREKRLPMISGLAALVRIANEYIEQEDEGVKNIDRGWSLSILNIVPEYIQTGNYHPVFKVRQTGLGQKSVIDIEGRTVCQSDRFLFSGVEVSQKRPVFFSINHSEQQVEEYAAKGRLDQFGDRASLPGIMFGISNDRAQISTSVRLFQIEGGLLPQDKIENVESWATFKFKYEQSKQLSGVYTSEQLIGHLSELDIKMSEETLQKWSEHDTKTSVFKSS